MDSPRISRGKEAAIRTIVAAKDGPRYMYNPECIQISRYHIPDILNRGQLVPGDGGALGTRSLRFRPPPKTRYEISPNSGIDYLRRSYLSTTPRVHRAKNFGDMCKLRKN